MRWFWIDRFTEFISGKSAVAVKNVSLSEEHVVDYYPGWPAMPSSLILEGVAQTAGLLVGEHNRFEERVILAKVSRAKFHFSPTPGETLTYSTVIEDIRTDGAFITGTSHVGQRLQAEIELYFAHLDDRFEGVDLFAPAEFLRLLRMMRIFDVGRTQDGERLTIPARLLQAEQKDLAVPLTVSESIH